MADQPPLPENLAALIGSTDSAASREDVLAEVARRLAETTANLDAYIEQRAQAIAAPRIAEAREEYVRIRDERSRKHAAEVQRLNDLVDELRRQVDVQVRRAERAEKKETNDG